MWCPKICKSCDNSKYHCTTKLPNCNQKYNRQAISKDFKKNCDDSKMLDNQAIFIIKKKCWLPWLP